MRIYTEASILRNIIGAILEIELLEEYTNTQIEVELQVMLIEIRFLKSNILLELNNTTVYSILIK